MTSWVCVKLWDHTCNEMLCALSCELWVVQSHDCGSFEDDEFLRDKYCDGIHFGNPTSWITLRSNKLKIFLEQLRSHVFCIVCRYSLGLKMFSVTTRQTISHNHIKIKRIKIIGSKTWKHQEHSILLTNSHQGINWLVKHKNPVIIIVKAELQYNKRPKINPNLIF